MAKIRNVSGEELYVPSLSRLVQSGQVVEVDPERVYAFTQSAIWEAVDKEAKAAELEAEADYQSALAAANPELVTDPDDAPDGTPTTDNNESQEG